MCIVNSPFKHIIPNDGNVSFVTYGHPEGSASGDITII